MPSSRDPHPESCPGEDCLPSAGITCKTHQTPPIPPPLLALSSEREVHRLGSRIIVPLQIDIIAPHRKLARRVDGQRLVPSHGRNGAVRLGPHLPLGCGTAVAALRAVDGDDVVPAGALEGLGGRDGQLALGGGGGGCEGEEGEEEGEDEGEEQHCTFGAGWVGGRW